MVANDTPFKVGQKVNVIRERHGWHDGRLEAKITNVYKRPTGTHYYIAKVVGQDAYLEISHTRDAYVV